MKVLVTGSAGFIGRNLTTHLLTSPGYEPLFFDRTTTDEQLRALLTEADAVVHLAGVNRPADPAEFEQVNAGLTSRLCDHLVALGRAVPILRVSSAQAELDNPYGVSKRAAEAAVREYGRRMSVPVAISRLPGVFGKWCRPNYNSVVATFCHNAAHDLASQISDPARSVALVYIDDVVRTFVEVLGHWPGTPVVVEPQVEPVFTKTLGELDGLVRAFRASRSTLELPDFADAFTRRLYTTYLSYLATDDFAYSLTQHTDPRGSLAELIKGASFGQMFVSRTHPGITRGNHYHHSKVEKFVVVEGEAVIRFRHLISGETAAYPVSGREFRVVDIPPGWAHSIENVGTAEMVVLFWASERFNPSVPDTYAAEVQR